jgi:(p)ppGpp synthase/HD superfamily hydrolase
VKYLYSYDLFVLEKIFLGEITIDGYDDVVNYMMIQHEGQWRKFQKKPYAIHPLRVAKIVQRYTYDKELVIAALCHDILEDTKENWINMSNRFGKRVAILVQELTNHIPSHRKEQKTSFLIKKMIQISDDALTIKLADRLDNVSDILDNSVPDKIKEKNWIETMTIIKNLEKLRTLKSIHINLIDKIKDTLNTYKNVKNESQIIIYNSIEDISDEY